MIAHVRAELTWGDNQILKSHIKETFKFLSWKKNIAADQFTSNDINIIEKRDFEQFCQLSTTSCWYTKSIMKLYTEHQWSSLVSNKLATEGMTRVPNITMTPLPISPDVSRDDEVKVMSMFYQNNLLNSFLYKTQREQCPSPLCPCGVDEQTSFHVLCLEIFLLQ